MATDRVTASAAPANLVGAAEVTHELWEPAWAQRNVLARQAALAALDDRADDAKRWAKVMLAAEVVMDGIMHQLDQEPSGKKSIR